MILSYFQQYLVGYSDVHFKEYADLIIFLVFIDNNVICFSFTADNLKPQFFCGFVWTRNWST